MLVPAGVQTHAQNQRDCSTCNGNADRRLQPAREHGSARRRHERIPARCTVFTLALQPNSVTGCIMGDPGMTRPMTLTVKNNSAVLLTGGGIHYDLDRIRPNVYAGGYWIKIVADLSVRPKSLTISNDDAVAIGRRRRPDYPSRRATLVQLATFVRFEFSAIAFTIPVRSTTMKLKTLLTSATTLFAVGLLAAPQASAQAPAQKPNILFIMGDDIGWMQPSIYHRGLMVGETPNIDRIGHEGAMFTDYYAEQSCTAGRNAFFTGMHPLRTGMIPPQLPGSPSYLRPGTPALAKFLHDLGYNTGEFGKNHLGDHTDALPTAHGFQEFWGYLYHLDAMQGVSFPDINKTPTEQTVAPPCKNTPIPGLPEVPGAVDPKTTPCLTPPRPVLVVQVLRRHGGEPDLQGRGPADAGAVEDRGRGDLGQGHRLPRPQRSEEDQQAVLRLVQPGAHAHHDRAVAQVLGDGRRARRQGLGRQRSRHEADGRQHRLRAEEARGDGPARQHHRRLHHRQRRRDDHLPRRRHHARSRAAS